MALTYEEQVRLKNAEETTQSLKTLIDGASSKNQLKQLLVLCQEQLRRVESRLDTIESDLSELLTLARKLQ
jgi:hypothetical protein